MTMQTKKPFYASAQDVEAAFYDALERADIDIMMSVWAEDEEVICVHPGGPRLAGYAQVINAWRRFFEAGPSLKVRLSNQVVLQGLLFAVHSVHEHITVAGEETLRAPIVATNVYLRGATGWRMLAHHASAAPVAAELIGESSSTLH